MQEKPLGVPDLRPVNTAMLGEALRSGWQDFLKAPGYGFPFSGVCVLIGWIMLWVTYATGQSYWMIFAAVSFPLVGPFVAVGLYEVSHRLGAGRDLNRSEILGVVIEQSKRQLPSLCAVIIIMFLFWFFVAHMIFALFLGFSQMVNISSSYEVFLTAEGMSMLAFGTAIGAAFALVLYNCTVIALPLLLDREVDFVTAMITSWQVVLGNFVPMLIWAVVIAVLTFAAMIPGFVGLFLALPVLGHASWHLYRQIRVI